MKDTRWSCGGPLHHYPMPDDDRTRQKMTKARKQQGWRLTLCGDCGIHGWEPGDAREDIRNIGRRSEYAR